MIKGFIILFILATFLSSTHNLYSQQAKQRTVIFDHDGGVDDFLSLIMILSMSHIKLEGVIITPADCFLQPATSATLKILRFFNKYDIEVSKGNLLGQNSFPRDWRRVAYSIDALPILNESEDNLLKTSLLLGHEFLAKKLNESSKLVTILITGPVTNLVATLSSSPKLISKIEEVIWMGGAINVRGNVQDYEHDGSAEWNAYWDPVSTHTFLRYNIPKTIFPLDITNKVPVTREFLLRLAKQRKYPLSDLTGQCWAMTVGVIPSYEYIYFMWDTLTTGFLGVPHLFKFREIRCDIVRKGKSAGKIFAVENDGSMIKMAEDIDIQSFLDYILNLLQK